jgi:hypothetical protein
MTIGPAERRQERGVFAYKMLDATCRNISLCSASRTAVPKAMHTLAQCTRDKTATRPEGHPTRARGSAL